MKGESDTTYVQPEREGKLPLVCHSLGRENKYGGPSIYEQAAFRNNYGQYTYNILQEFSIVWIFFLIISLNEF